MVKIDETKTNYIICEDFDGERRLCYPYAYSFTKIEHAKETLDKAKKRYKDMLKDENIKTWIKEHKVSEPYLVVIDMKKEGK